MEEKRAHTCLTITQWPSGRFDTKNQFVLPFRNKGALERMPSRTTPSSDDLKSKGLLSLECYPCITASGFNRATLLASRAPATVSTTPSMFSFSRTLPAEAVLSPDRT